MKKLIVSNLLLAFATFFATAQSNQKAMEYFLFGLNEPAKTILTENLTTGTTSSQAEAAFFLGEVYFAETKKDSALYFYTKGLASDPAFIFNAIGQAKLQLNTNAAEAEKTLNGIASKNKKNMDVQAAIARAYLENNMPDKAAKVIDAAMNTNNSSSVIYLVQGDMFAKKNDFGNAGSAYEQAIYFDAQNKAAYLNYARIFSSRNMASAIGMLQNLEGIDNTSFLPYREMAEIYFQHARYGNALNAYKKFIENDKFSLSDYPTYASLLFFSGDNTKSLEIVKTGLKGNPSNFVLNRFLMWNLFELKQYAEGMKEGDKFMNMQGDFIYLDYVYYSKLLTENNRKEEAIAAMEKGLLTDATKIADYKTIAKLYSDLGQYDNSIKYYNIYIEKAGEQANTDDYLTLGRAYYTAVTLDTLMNKTQKEAYVLKGDSVFSYAAQQNPESYTANLWRARINFVLDTEVEKGLSKPYYEAVIPLLKPEEQREKDILIEAYRYLGYYYIVKNDIKNSKVFWDKVIELDPANQQALDALKGIKSAIQQQSAK
jgi:tetratricopeptide (TPR) repeat protein